MALVLQAGMDSPLTCYARSDRFPGLPSGSTQLPGWAVQRPPGTCLRSHFAVPGLFLAFICCQAGRFSVRRRPVSGFTSLVLDSLGQ